MKTSEVLNNTHNNQLIPIKKGSLLLANVNYAKVANKTFEIAAKTVLLGVVLTIVNIII